MKWLLVAVFAFVAALDVAALDVAAIGKPRRPVTPAQGIIGALICLGYAVYVAVTW